MSAQVLTDGNVVTILLGVIVLFSVLLGVRRGASGSARHLLSFVLDTAAVVVSALASYWTAMALSPLVQRQMAEWSIAIPARELAWWEQIGYTLLTGIRDFPLLRFAVLFALIYMVIRWIAGWALGALVPAAGRELGDPSRGAAEAGPLKTVGNWIAGAVLGGIIGMARALLVILVLFAYVTWQPDTKASAIIRDSEAYRLAAEELIEPVAGDFISSQWPVFTSQVAEELSKLMQRKYEVVDSHIPDDIEQAAADITAGARSDEEKARKLYDWVGSRVQYDWDKAKQYETKRIWKEQTPQDTFATKQGVCIDYARLYAVMARASALKVKVVTGLGYNGQGGYGPHAWNEVWLSEEERWVPLDATWASSGDWFNPPDFAKTHVPDKIAAG
ncbi:MAG: transglutaminase domain-containing protein [Paenibacillus dendritiformis]|uniref:transglutaminase domain-containing protein n=1 Tax=uncultured Paenibacillus sp. TaxID=227322 RepID=UPI0025FC63D7|nr:transglutaminase domain-containing protein [uncultured Paenibacillus sp.]MDU5141675.1 transglutaminase domain-containing protein [Paenibacillus dendritiformis]